MKLKKKSILCLSIGIILFCLYVFLCQGRYPCVRKGITMREAQRLADSQDGYFIVTQNEAATGARYIIAYGDYERAEVELRGDIPDKSLSIVFFFSASNYFLVQGEELNTHNRGKPHDEVFVTAEDYTAEMYAIDVKQWDIITPIRRDYTYTKHERLFYPTRFLDAFDVEHQDYLTGDGTSFFEGLKK